MIRRQDHKTKLLARLSFIRRLKVRESGRNRRPVFEQFEDRRLLAVVRDDFYTVGVNGTLTSSAWENDTWTNSWNGTLGVCAEYDEYEQCVRWEDVPTTFYVSGDIVIEP